MKNIILWITNGTVEKQLQIHIQPLLTIGLCLIFSMMTDNTY